MLVTTVLDGWTRKRPHAPVKPTGAAGGLAVRQGVLCMNGKNEQRNIVSKAPPGRRGTAVLAASKGFTLAETLLAMIILLMVTSVAAGGIPAAVRAYRNTAEAANARVLMTTMRRKSLSPPRTIWPWLRARIIWGLTTKDLEIPRIRKPACIIL